MTKQLTLDISDTQASFREDDFFISESNILAHRMVAYWPKWAAQGLILCGNSGSGKTHLAHIWRQRSRALFFSLEDIIYCNGLFGDHVILENAEDFFSRQDEETLRLLLRFINFLAQNNCFFLLTASRPPAFWDITLPDLASRLRALPHASLEEPDDALLEVMLQRNFFLRQLHVSPDAISYLLKRIPRSFSSIRWWTKHIDKESLSHSRTITIPFLKSLLHNACTF